MEKYRSTLPYLHRAEMFKDRDRFQESLRDLRTLADLDPSCHPLWVSLANHCRIFAQKAHQNPSLFVAYLLAGRRYLLRALSLEPKYRPAKKELEYFQKTMALHLKNFGFLSPHYEASPEFYRIIHREIQVSLSPLLQKEFSLLVFERLQKSPDSFLRKEIPLCQKYLKNYLGKKRDSLDHQWIREALEFFRR